MLSVLRAVYLLSVFVTVAMADALAKVPDVEIDPEGIFKYILVRIKVKDEDVHKDIVRGTKSAEYHSKFMYCVAAQRGLYYGLSMGIQHSPILASFLYWQNDTKCLVEITNK